MHEKARWRSLRLVRKSASRVQNTEARELRDEGRQPVTNWKHCLLFHPSKVFVALCCLRLRHAKSRPFQNLLARLLTQRGWPPTTDTVREKLEQFRKHRKRREAKCATMSRYLHDRHADGRGRSQSREKSCDLVSRGTIPQRPKKHQGTIQFTPFTSRLLAQHRYQSSRAIDDATRCPARPIGFPHVASWPHALVHVRTLSKNGRGTAVVTLSGLSLDRCGDGLDAELKLGSGIIFTHHNSRCLDFAKGSR